MCKSPDPTSKGVVYIATGDNCRNEALVSARSLKATNPDLKVCLFTDVIVTELSAYFDIVRIIESPGKGSSNKVYYITETPFDYTVFLDSDTLVLESIEDLFEPLDRFDFGASVEVARGYWYDNKTTWSSIPRSFPELNSGVFVFRKNEKVKQLFADWIKYYNESQVWQSVASPGRVWDQPSLRKAIYENSAIRVFSIPNEYNALRFFGTYVWGKVVIVHGRNIKNVAKDMNFAIDVERVFCQNIGMVSRFHNMGFKKFWATVIRFNYCAFVDLMYRVVKKRSPY